MEYKRIAIDTSKHVFTLHGIDAQDRVVLQRNLSRSQVERFFAQLLPSEVALEACGASHHWGRMLQGQGHRVRLIPPQYVKPFVRRGKNDRIDAAAICEAAGRPDMTFVPVKSAQQQAEAMLLSVRDLLVRQQTQAANALRGHAAEFGVVAAKGIGHIPALPAAVQTSDMPQAGREAIDLLHRQFEALAGQLGEIDRRLRALHKANPLSQRLAQVPGVGPVGSVTLALGVEPGRFRDGRHFAAWLGLTPKEQSTGGRQRIGGISRAGNERMRQLLVLGAMSVIRNAKPGAASPWLISLLARKPRKVAAVALANKMARIVWAMMARGQAYRRPVAGSLPQAA